MSAKTCVVVLRSRYSCSSVHSSDSVELHAPPAVQRQQDAAAVAMEEMTTRSMGSPPRPSEEGAAAYVTSSEVCDDDRYYCMASFGIGISLELQGCNYRQPLDSTLLPDKKE